MQSSNNKNTILNISFYCDDICFPFYFSPLSNESQSQKADDERGNKVCIMNTAANDDKNKNMCRSVASYSICSEKRPDNKQTTLRKKES